MSQSDSVKSLRFAAVHQPLYRSEDERVWIFRPPERVRSEVERLVMGGLLGNNSIPVSFSETAKRARLLMLYGGSEERRFEDSFLFNNPNQIPLDYPNAIVALPGNRSEQANIAFSLYKETKDILFSAIAYHTGINRQDLFKWEKRRLLDHIYHLSFLKGNLNNLDVYFENPDVPSPAAILYQCSRALDRFYGIDVDIQRRNTSIRPYIGISEKDVQLRIVATVPLIMEHARFDTSAFRDRQKQLLWRNQG